MDEVNEAENGSDYCPCCESAGLIESYLSVVAEASALATANGISADEFKALELDYGFGALSGGTIAYAF